MKAVGIIAEYNPFHNGHLYHISEVKKQSQAEIIICIMTGHFNMRGEPSACDKFTKTRWALEYGIDIVIELPLINAVQSADYFALNAVFLLDKLRVDEIYFGSEKNDISHLKTIASKIDSETFSKAISSNPSLSYAKASEIGLGERISPNDMLGSLYIYSINKLKSPIIPVTIKRTGSSYNDEEASSETIASARAIRKMSCITPYVPPLVNKHFQEKGFVSLDAFFPYLKYQTIISDYSNIFGFNKDLSRMFKNKRIDTFEDINFLVSTKFTRSRINRLFCYALLNIPKDINPTYPKYIRVLGMNEKGQTYLNTIKKQLDLPLIVKVKEGMFTSLDIDIRSSRVYSLIYHKDVAKEEFLPPIMKIG